MGSCYATQVVPDGGYALAPERFVRSVQASRATLDLPPMRLLEVVDRVSALTGNAPYAVVGGLAQMLWARKTHTDDLDITLAAPDLGAAYDKVRQQQTAPEWTLPQSPDRPREDNDVFTVCHLLYRGAVVDLLTFRDEELTNEVVSTSRAVAELGHVRFIRPELLLMTHLLRPGVRGALAAIELILARREAGGFDVDYAEHWARRLGKADKLTQALRRADEMGLD